MRSSTKFRRIEKILELLSKGFIARSSTQLMPRGSMYRWPKGPPGMARPRHG